MDVQTNIKKIRNARGITQKAISSYLGVSQMRYYRIENLNQAIDPLILKKIAKYLDVNINIFFDDKLTESVVKKYSKVVS